MAYFDRLAHDRGLPFRAISRGTAPDAELPAFMMRGLTMDGFDVAAFVPTRFDATALAGAIHVVSFDVPALPTAGLRQERWDKLPSVSADYSRGSSAIKARVEALVDSLIAARRSTPF